MTGGAFGEPHCDNSGRCTALGSDRKYGSSNCLYCGKQMDLAPDGQWYTWEARFLPPEDRRPRDEQPARAD